MTKYLSLNRVIFNAFFLMAVIALQSYFVAAQTTEFSYQGSLKNGGIPANGNYDMQFFLYTTSAGGTFIASSSKFNIPVANGLFNVGLDFGGDNFAGQRLYLETSVRPAGSGSYTPLAPRQEFLSTPYAIRSYYSQFAHNANILGGIGAAFYVLTGDPRMSDARSPLPNSPNYIQNSTIVQSGVNFNISGTGSVGGTMTANMFNTPTQYLINGQNALLMNSNNLLVGSAPPFVNPSVGNTIIGLDAGRSLFESNQNTFTGRDSGRNFISGGQNTFYGAGSGRDANNGNYNTYLGAETGNANTSGGNWQTMVGAFANVRIGFLNNATAIGYRAAVDQSNSLVLGASDGVNGATADTNVGIGTSSPNFRLDVVGRMRLQQKLNAAGSTDTAGLWLYQRTPNADRAFIGMQDDGKVGFYGNNGGGWGFAMNTATGTSIVNFLGSAGSTQLCRNASNEISSCSSSIRYKDKVQNFRPGLDLIKKLRPVSFNWKADGKEDLGLVAEEVAAAEPLLVTRNDKGEVEGVKYDRVGVVLVNAVSEQQTQIETLEKKIDEQNELIKKQEEAFKKQQAELDALKKLVCSQNPAAAICQPQN